LELGHGLKFRTQRTSGFHGGEDTVWNVTSSNITDTPTIENTKLFSEERGSLILKII
jgi:hypothetical protein